MNENPYQAPTTFQTAISPRGSFWKLVGIFELVVCLNLVALLAVAFAHRMQVGDPEAYIRGPLIPILGLCLLTTLLLLPVTLIRTILFYVTGRPGKGTACLLLCIATVVSILAVPMIDWPLIYAT